MRRAIEHDRPPRIPYAFLMPVRSDFFETAALDALLAAGAPARPAVGEAYCDDWGVRRQATGGSWDRVLEHPLRDLGDPRALRTPKVADTERLARIASLLERARAAGKYVLAADPVLLYERAQALVGFEELMVAPYSNPAGLGRLLDHLADLTIEAIDALAGLGLVDGFMTWQDLASQSEPHMRPETFRAFYAPRYARVARAAHGAGMHLFWHTCGQVLDLLPELIALGVDVVQLDQPRLLGHRTLAERFAGRVCFWNTVDLPWATSDEPSAGALREEIAAMTRPFRGLSGGLMVRHYPLPRDVGLSEEFHRVSAAAFLESGCGLDDGDATPC